MSPSNEKSRPNESKKGTGGSFTAEERAAMRERAQELKAAKSKVEGETAVLAKIDELPEPDRSMGRRLHEIIKSALPSLNPRLWYGMPAYAKDDKVLCFFQSGQKFKTRYCTFGFSDTAKLDEGNMWTTGFALKELTEVEEERIRALVSKAAR